VSRDRARIAVRVAPGSRRNDVLGRHGEAWRIAVAAAPERGRANAAVCELLAGALGVHRRDVTVVIGHTARDKVIEVNGCSAADVDRLLAAWQGKGGG
jgi:uncharacterized protein YggU (UPF0235/DUF167 family)